ncbi:hypothetical protein DL93DRAFT_2159014 [Clavulina sp. PMI_390]|nr:hypothetical protein DL93DRAFT_2159014 [Clavulina sp. PMI_390]
MRFATSPCLSHQYTGSITLFISLSSACMAPISYTYYRKTSSRADQIEKEARLLGAIISRLECLFSASRQQGQTTWGCISTQMTLLLLELPIYRSTLAEELALPACSYRPPFRSHPSMLHPLKDPATIMPHFFSSLLHYAAGCLYPGPPLSMDSPIPEILNKPQYIEVISRAITEGSVANPPDVHRRYRLRRVAITKSQRVSKIYHQTLVLELDEPGNCGEYHILVAERCTSPRDYPLVNGGQGIPNITLPLSESFDPTNDYLLPTGDGRDVIRWWGRTVKPEGAFWNSTKGDSQAHFQANNGVVFDFMPPSGLSTVTLHQVILAMRAVTLVSPAYQFFVTNCWWWAQTVLLLLLQLRHPTQNLATVKLEENFFNKIQNPGIVMEYPRYLGLNFILDEKIIFRDAGMAHAKYLNLARDAEASLQRHQALASIPAERDAAVEQLRIQTTRANAAQLKAERKQREYEAALAELANLRSQQT